MVRNAAQIPKLLQSHLIRNDAQSGWDQPPSYCSKPCVNDSEVWDIECAAAGICTSCPVRANQSTTHMVSEYRSWWL